MVHIDAYLCKLHVVEHEGKLLGAQNVMNHAVTPAPALVGLYFLGIADSFLT